VALAIREYKFLHFFASQVIKYTGGKNMRLSELGGKEIVNLYNGERLGVINNTDLVIDEKTGEILYLIIPKKESPFLFSVKELKPKSLGML